MSLCLYGTKEPGYVPLDIDSLTNEQANEIAGKIHRIALDYSELKELTPLSTRLQRALSWLDPKVVTLLDVRMKPLETWRTHAAMTWRIYHELREVVRPFGVSLPAWEMLP